MSIEMIFIRKRSIFVLCHTRPLTGVKDGGPQVKILLHVSPELQHEIPQQVCPVLQM